MFTNYCPDHSSGHSHAKNTTGAIDNSSLYSSVSDSSMIRTKLTSSTAMPMHSLVRRGKLDNFFIMSSPFVLIIA